MEIEFKQCTLCNGEKTINLSNCCESPLHEDICTECGEHCDKIKCGMCEGEGEIPVNFDNYEDNLINECDNEYDLRKLKDK